MVAATDVTWVASIDARAVLLKVEGLLGADEYSAQRTALRSFLCGYFGAVPGCSQKQGKTISPVGGGEGQKLLKIRWALPGCGKSGGLRLIVGVDCARMRVVIWSAEFRSQLG